MRDVQRLRIHESDFRRLFFGSSVLEGLTTAGAGSLRMDPEHICALKRAFDGVEEASEIEAYGEEYEAYECPVCGKLHIRRTGSAV